MPPELPEPAQSPESRSASEPTDCPFCKIARGEIKADLIAESETAVAFWDLAPQAPVHILVIPRAHVASMADAPSPAVLGELLRMAAEVARREGLEPGGYRTVINTGRDGGQTVHHLHAHVLGGRRMAWPPG